MYMLRKRNLRARLDRFIAFSCAPYAKHKGKTVGLQQQPKCIHPSHRIKVNRIKRKPYTFGISFDPQQKQQQQRPNRPLPSDTRRHVRAVCCRKRKREFLGLCATARRSTGTRQFFHEGVGVRVSGVSFTFKEEEWE